MLYRVEQLKENPLNDVVVAEVTTAVEDLGEEVAITGVIHNDIGVIVILDDAV